MIWRAGLVLLLCLDGISPALAQSSRGARDIEQANRALDAGEYEHARVMVHAILDGEPAITRAERGEGFRILALVNFFEDKLDLSRAAFLEMLRSDPDAHLDPALVPPEAISLLEDVRARNSAELEAYRKKPRKKRYLLLNLVPAGGQFQNGERTKGYVLATGIGLLFSANLGSWLALESYCDNEDRTCSTSDGIDKADTARTLQTVNVVAGVGLISLYAYSVLDGYLGYRRAQRRERESDDYMSFALVPTQQGASFAWSLRF